MGGKNDAPDYPKAIMREQLALSEAQANRFFDLSEQQQEWAQSMFSDYMLPMMEDVSGTQADVMREQLLNARRDRERYEQRYQPLEDDLIREFQRYDTGARRNLEAGRAMAGVARAHDAQRANAEQRLASYGIDPSQLRTGALDLQARTAQAAQMAAAGNAARQRVEDTGRALRAEAINIGRGMPSQVAQSYGQTLNAGTSAMGNVNAAVGQGANIMGTGQGWGQMGGNQLGQTMQGINNMYSGQLAGYEASGGALGALGNIAGQALGAWAGSGFVEGGGAVGVLPDDNMTRKNASYAEGGGAALNLQGSDMSPVPGPNDTIPITVAEGEYIIPKDVVMRMGTEKLDKLIESTRQKNPSGANQNTQVGDMPNPEPPLKGQTYAANPGPRAGGGDVPAAQGGGAVGYMPPEAIQAMPSPVPVNPAWGMGMYDAADPFAAYRRAKQVEADAADSFVSGLGTGQALRENWDERKGLPGKLRNWLDQRDADRYNRENPALTTAERENRAVPVSAPARI